MTMTILTLVFIGFRYGILFEVLWGIFHSIRVFRDMFDGNFNCFRAFPFNSNQFHQILQYTQQMFMISIYSLPIRKLWRLFVVKSRQSVYNLLPSNFVPYLLELLCAGALFANAIIFNLNLFIKKRKIMKMEGTFFLAVLHIFCSFFWY